MSAAEYEPAPAASSARRFVAKVEHWNRYGGMADRAAMFDDAMTDARFDAIWRQAWDAKRGSAKAETIAMRALRSSNL